MLTYADLPALRTIVAAAIAAAIAAAGPRCVLFAAAAAVGECRARCPPLPRGPAPCPPSPFPYALLALPAEASCTCPSPQRRGGCLWLRPSSRRIKRGHARWPGRARRKTCTAPGPSLPAGLTVPAPSGRTQTRIHRGNTYACVPPIYVRTVTLIRPLSTCPSLHVQAAYIRMCAPAHTRTHVPYAQAQAQSSSPLSATVT